MKKIYNFSFLFHNLITKRSFSLFVVFALALSMIWNAQISRAATTDAALFFNPASTSVAVGADFNLAVRVNPGSNTVQGVNAVQLNITFNPAILQINTTVGVNHDGIIPSSPFVQISAATVDNVNGTLSVALFIGGSQITTTSDVAILAFHAQTASANSPVAFASSADVAVNDDNGTYVVLTRTPALITVTGVTYDNADFADLVTDWLQTGSSSADVNSDNIVNARDLGIMMSNWQP